MSADVNSEHKISVKMFGFFDITFKDKSIFLESTNSIKSIAILRFMLSQRNKLFLSETIAENVWPENEYLDEKKVIRTYIHRLRKIISLDNAFRRDFSDDIRILNVKGSYTLETSDAVEMDTDNFDNIKNEVNSAETCTQLLSIFENLLKIYRGEFLEECKYDHWVLMLRNYYLRLFCSTVNNILSKLEELSAFSQIIDVCERSLKIYELDEGINIAFIKALVESSQSTNALQHYNYITSKMYNELSVTPSEKMRSVYNKIKAKRPSTPGDTVNTMEMIDSNTLALMIDEAIKHQLAPEKNKFSIGYIKVVPNELNSGPNGVFSNIINTEEHRQAVLDSLKLAIEFALRKNDMYVMTDDFSALIVLSEATEASFPVISNRINQSFYSRHDGFDSKLVIRIYPSIKII